MPVSPVNDNADANIVLASRKQTGAGEFSRTLSNAARSTKKASPESGSVSNPKDNSVIELGRISKETPTVSHILINHPEFSNKCWDIIFSPENRGKEFTKMKEGTVVALRSGSNELVWGAEPSSTSGKVQGEAKADIRVTAALPSQPHSQTEELKKLPQRENSSIMHNESLANAVRQYIGTPYNKIDCYGLVIRGLQNQGIQYKGPGGIREMLEHLATSKGLPGNAYFNGEGLVEKAGTRVFSKSIRDVSNTGKQTEELYSEIRPYLSEGSILSFSTSSRGHTGIVSRQGDNWTYINSGIIDNEVIPVRAAKGVGEEYLKAEIKNWLKIAANRKEPLTVTLGRLDEETLSFQTDGISG